MQPAARSTLVALVEEHLTTLIREAEAVKRHCKRARITSVGTSDADYTNIVRRRLQAADINMALQIRGSEKLYGTPLMDEDLNQKPVNLRTYIQDDEPRNLAPSEVAWHQQWLAVDGVAPAVTRGSAPRVASSSSSGNLADSMQVHQLQASLLSEELQLYYRRVTDTLQRRRPDEVILSVARDAGLQELVPFFVRYCQYELYAHVITGGAPPPALLPGQAEAGGGAEMSPSSSRMEHGRTIVRLIQALLMNPHLHLELHLHELLPALMTCVVAKRLTTNKNSLTLENHWALRREAAATLVMIGHLFGDEYPTLKARILRTLCQTLQRPKNTARPAQDAATARPTVVSTTASRYGGLVGMTLFGGKAVDAFVLPVASAHWDEWMAALEVQQNAAQKLESTMAVRALLDAVCVWLRQVNDKAARVPWHDLEQTFGPDRLVALQGLSHEYATCFV
jgi:transcription initiation factor TFIID subunit 6